MKRATELKRGKPLTRKASNTLRTTELRRRGLTPSRSEPCPARVKAALIERDGLCLRCGCSANVAHHIVRRPLPKAILWDLRLLALLCWDCHGAVHADVGEAKKQGLIVSRFSDKGRALLAEAMAAAREED